MSLFIWRPVYILAYIQIKQNFPFSEYSIHGFHCILQQKLTAYGTSIFTFNFVGCQPKTDTALSDEVSSQVQQQQQQQQQQPAAAATIWM